MCYSAKNIHNTYIFFSALMIYTSFGLAFVFVWPPTFENVFLVIRFSSSFEFRYLSLYFRILIWEFFRGCSLRILSHLNCHKKATRLLYFSSNILVLSGYSQPLVDQNQNLAGKYVISQIIIKIELFNLK